MFMPGVWILWSKKNFFFIIFQKENGNTFTLFIIFIVKSLQKEQNSTNLLLWPPICRNKPAITPKWFNSLDTNSIFSNRTPSNYFWHFKVSTILYRFSQLSILKTLCLLIVRTLVFATSHQVWTAVTSKTWAWLWFSNE